MGERLNVSRAEQLVGRKCSMSQFLIETFDVALREQAVIRQSLSSHTRHSGSEHKQRRENSDNEENDKTANLELEGLQTFTLIQNTSGYNPGENSALCKQNRSVGAGTLPHETQPPAAIRMGRRKVQFYAVDLP